MGGNELKKTHVAQEQNPLPTNASGTIGNSAQLTRPRHFGAGVHCCLPAWSSIHNAPLLTRKVCYMPADVSSVRRILNKCVFEQKTESLGTLRCQDVTLAIRDVWKKSKAPKFDGPEFVRRLLCHVARRIDGESEVCDKANAGTPLCESDVQGLTDKEVESLAREIVNNNGWIFESLENSRRATLTDETGKRNSRVKRRKTKDTRGEDERDSDFLLRSVKTYMANNQRRRRAELRQVTPWSDGHLNQIESIARSLTDSNLTALKQIEDISRATNSALLPYTGIAEIMAANQHLHDMLEQAWPLSGLVANMDHFHRTWLQELDRRQDQASLLQMATKGAMEEIANRLTLSEQILASVNLDAINQFIVSRESQVERLRDSIIRMSENYSRVAMSIQDTQRILDLPKFVLPGATREIFVTGYALDSLYISDETDEEPAFSESQSVVDTVGEIEDEVSTCMALLSDVDPNLAKLYAGARSALRGTNPDRARHFLSSVRELWSHLLRTIAPDRKVKNWVPKNDTQLLREGKPTRKARVLYVCRELNHGGLSKFVYSDTRAFNEFLDVFNRVHQLDPDFSDQQLHALQLRSDSYLTYILQIRSESL